MTPARRLPTLLATSFQAKLVAAVLGIVALLLGTAVVTLQWVTRDQIELAVQRASAQARAAFDEWEALRLNELERVARPFTGTVRAAVLISEASQGTDLDLLAEEASYELLRSRIDTSLVTFTDEFGRPFLTLVDGERAAEEDPADVSALVRRLLNGSEPRVHGYRHVRDRLFLVQVEPAFLGDAVVGQVGFGSPVTDGDARRLGEVVGAEVCLIVRGRCVASTPGTGEGLRDALVQVSAVHRSRRISADGRDWQVVVDPLVEGHPEEGMRATSVPLGPIVTPFRTILSVLAMGGLVAFVVAVLLILRLSHGLTRPVTELVGAARRVEGGDYDTTVDVTSRDELGTLAAAFNDMTRGLRLKETYRGVLDKVVSRDVAEELLSGEIELGGETREATVLFADLRGFTALTENMDPHAVIELLNGCMERLTAAVEEEGGVVDKYVGDELMAVFGAPVSRGDDAMRACRAAERMTASLEAMNRERAARDEPPVGAGVGIGTGLVVAGNMGTTRRLNYTVLGSTVNLAARIGDAARAGEVLLSRGTVDAVGDRVLVEALPAMALRGFSRPVEVFRLVRTAVSAAALLAVLALALALAPAASRAQEGLPTLSDLGLRYRSPSGSVELQLSGRLDLETYLPGDEPSWIVPSTDPFFAARARTFADLFVGDRLRATVELRVDRGEEPAAGDYEARIDQAYASARPFAGADLLVQVGKFASPFGGYAARHHTTRDPFVRPPLAYDWRTTIPTRQAPADLAEMVALRSPVNRTRARGAPIVWGVPYQWGAQVLANLAGFSLRGATVTSAPAGAPRTWELDADAGLGSAWVVGIARQLGASLQVDLSWSRGPYLTEDVSGIPAGRAFDDYRQTILGVEAIYARGPFVLRGELFDDTWEVPNLDRDLGDRSWYVEGQWDVRAGLFAAARYGSTSFESVPGSGDEGWDWHVRRLELAAGYRIARNLGVQAEVAFNRTPGAARDPSDDLAAIQLWWSY